MDAHQIRRLNLQLIIDQYHSGKKLAMAERMGWKSQRI